MTVSTLTIVAVFMPIALMDNNVGQFFKPFGLTVSVAVLTSLLVARTLSPVLAVYFLRKKSVGAQKLENSPPSPPNLGGTRLESPTGLGNNYRKLLKWSLSHRPIVIAIAIMSLVIGIALIPYIPKGFIPQLDRAEFNVTYTTSLPKLVTKSPTISNPEPTNSQNFSWLNNIARSPQRILLRRTLRIGEQIEPVILSLPDVESTYNIVGINGEPNKGRFYVKLKSDKNLSTAEVQQELREALADIPKVEISVEDIPFIEIGGKQNLRIALVGEDLISLTNAAQTLKNRVQELPGFVDLKVTGSEIKDNLPQKIEHFNGERVVYLDANLSDGKAIGDGTAEVVAIAESLIPEGVSIKLSGDSAISSDILSNFAGTIGLSVACMLLLLILPFGRLLEPIVVGLCLPLSLIGSVLALLFTQSDFGMISLIGVIFLLGLLDKNALLLMDYANQLRRSGLHRTEAILKTGTVRLRPILMTTASTILGMMPIALGWGAGSELRQPMAVTIIGGLITSSLLSLILVPILYSLLEDLFIRKKT